MNTQQKTLILVDALNLLKNLSVRTYTLGTTCRDNKKVLQTNLIKVVDAIISLLKATGLNIHDVINESKHYLTIADRITRTKSGHINPRDADGMS